MTIAFQSAVFALIAISFLLVIGVPVALASPEVGQVAKMLYFRVYHYGSDQSFL